MGDAVWAEMARGLARLERRRAAVQRELAAMEAEIKRAYVRLDHLLAGEPAEVQTTELTDRGDVTTNPAAFRPEAVARWRTGRPKRGGLDGIGGGNSL